MTDRISLVVLVSGPDRAVAQATKWVACQPDGDVEVIIVHDRRDTDAARRRIAHDLARFEIAVVNASGLSPGAARNSGIQASRGRYFMVLNGDEDLDPGYLQRARVALSNYPEASCAVAPVIDLRPSRSMRKGPVGTLRLSQLLTGPWAVSRAAVVHRGAFDRVGAFDGSLQDFVEWDLLLSLAEGGATIAMIERSGSTWLEGGDVLRSPSLRADRHLPAVRKIFEKHRASFEQHAAQALTAREQIAHRLWLRERDLVMRRDSLRVALDSAVEELGRLRLALRPHGRDAVEWGDLRTTVPISRNWGSDRGTPIDRHYIHGFLASYAADVRGTVLEVLDPGLTQTYGGDRVIRSDVLDIDAGNTRATVVADLRAADNIPSNTYDCFILTQTLHVISDMPAALAHAHRILKPGGVLLVTMPSASMLSRDDGSEGDYWRVTEAAARRLFEREFEPSAIQLRARGNVFAIAAFLYGFSCEEVEREELEFNDPDYPLIVTIRAVKAASKAALVPPRSRRGAGILLYHRVATLAHDIHGLAISPRHFRSQLEHIVRHWRPMPLTELGAACVRGEPPEGAVAFTFDDGYVDNLLNAAPILAEFGVSATFFCTAERLSERRQFWWDALEQILLRTEALPPFLKVRIGDELRSFPTGDPLQRRAIHDQLYGILKGSLPAVRDDLIRQLSREIGGELATDGRPMIADEIRRLSLMPGIEIGAHGLHHLSLPSLQADQLHREIFEGRSALERIVGRPISLFAYPYGDVSEAAVEMARAADFDFAVSCDSRQLRGGERALRLPRLAPPSIEGQDFERWLEHLLGSATSSGADSFDHAERS